MAMGRSQWKKLPDAEACMDNGINEITCLFTQNSTGKRAGKGADM
jgi:hypothetical protein